MTKFLTGRELEGKLTDIIWNAKKYILIISPFIKLDDHIKKVFNDRNNKHDVKVFILFGKNEEYKHKSFSKVDLDFFKEFNKITILYNKDLHAKHYCNENEGLITSLNLYGFSMVNNIEYGVHFSKTLLNPLDKLFEETEVKTDEIVFEKSEVIYLKEQHYTNKLLGMKKVYHEPKVVFDITNDFFNGKKYEVKYLKDFEDEKYEEEERLVKNIKPIREETEIIPKTFIKKTPYKKKLNDMGYCIRTGREIPFNPEQPMSKNAWKTWNMFGDEHYPEQYCHKTGNESNGKTCMANPIL
ncbi:hypothetical protein SAMN05428642_104286 [Flaviramulus basaltis]|uniref:PLD-like domain-containing protein n=1 Tax=Flaviramulus basaltis TaxID=369401 RepID=A0A1K2IR00_9FLAO|nr:phospholipase D family protein [Flaviramulus basaltis]SFZ94624.1 hypothetical protein SAMN05428642_104286 [Flaviramulus basaltis]